MGFFGDLIDDFTGKTSRKAGEAFNERVTQGQGIISDQFGQTSESLAPFISAGSSAQNRLLSILGLEGGDGFNFEGTPGFQFALDQGLQAGDRAASAGGFLGGGRARKEAQRFGTGLAFQDRGNEINRLLGLTGSGQTAATNLASFGQNSANARANLGVQGGQATAEGIIGGSNARVGNLNNLLKLAGDSVGFLSGPGGTPA